MKRSSLKTALLEISNIPADYENENKEKREKAQREMANANFIQFCSQNLVVSLPLLLKIKDKKLILENYQLNYGLCTAIAMAFESFEDIATEFILSGNKMTDEDFAMVLRGMTKLTYV